MSERRRIDHLSAALAAREADPRRAVELTVRDRGQLTHLMARTSDPTVLLYEDADVPAGMMHVRRRDGSDELVPLHPDGDS